MGTIEVAGALELARQRRERGHEAYVLQLQAELAWRGDHRQPERGHEYYEQAMALASELGMRTLLAHCHLGLGRLHRSAGDRVRTREQLQAAVTQFGAMGMDACAAAAEAELTALG